MSFPQGPSWGRSQKLQTQDEVSETILYCLSRILYHIRLHRAKDFGDLPPRSGIQWSVNCELNVPIIVTPIWSVELTEYLVIMLVDKRACSTEVSESHYNE